MARHVSWTYTQAKMSYSLKAMAGRPADRFLGLISVTQISRIEFYILMQKKFIIIGSSAAGSAALSVLMRHEPVENIICLTQSEYKPYNTCLLSAYLGHRKQKAELFLFEQNQQLPILYNSKVNSINPEEQTVSLENGQSYAYTKLLIATGSAIYMPADFKHYIKKTRGVFAFHTLDDADAIITYCDNNRVKNIVIIGAGLTGLECAVMLASRGYTSILVEREKYILPKFLDKHAADWIAEYLQERFSIAIYTGGEISNIETGRECVTAVCFQTGIAIPADLVIFAMGALPEITLARQAGLIANNALEVNTFMQTSNEHIYAAGDCVIVNDKITGQKRVSNTWHEATMQGIVAAQNMLGNKKSYAGMLMHFTSCLGDATLVIMGSINYTTWQVERSYSNNYSIYFMSEDKKLKGYIGFGSNSAVGRIKKALLTQEIIENIKIFMKETYV